MQFLRGPGNAHPRSEIVLVREIERCAWRTVLQSAGIRIEHKADIVLVVVHAVVFVAETGVQRQVGTQFELIENVAVVRILACLGFDTRRTVRI